MKSLKVTSKKVSRIDNQYSNMAMWRENALAAYNAKLEMKKGVLHVTTPDDKHKLDGFDGINTSLCNNPHCILRRKKALEENRLDCICIRCYADSLLGCYKDVEINGRYNQQILTSHLLIEEDRKSVV